jgi:zinc protease
MAYKRDGTFAIASNLNEDIAAGDWTLYYTLDEATRKVTAADVKRVANLYLDPNRSVTGWFIPTVDTKSQMTEGGPATPPPSAPATK